MTSLTAAEHEAGNGILGEWAGLAGSILRLAMQAAGVPGGDAAADLLLSLTQAEDLQLNLLRSIKADTERILGEHLRTANLNLSEAMRVGADDPEWVNFVNDARRGLLRALGVAPENAEKAVVEFNLYVAWTLLGREEDARHWIELSRASANGAIDDMAAAINKNVKAVGRYLRDNRTGKQQDQSQRADTGSARFRKTRKVAQTVAGVAFVVTLVPTSPAWLAYIRLHEKQIQPKVQALEQFLTFYNLVERTWATSAPGNPSFVKLVRVIEGEHLSDAHYVVLESIP